MDNLKVDIIGAQIDFGASKRGVDMGPSAIRYAGLIEGLEKLGIECRDKGDIIPAPCGESKHPKLKNFHQVYDVNSRIYEEIGDSLSGGRIPILLGGDHSVAAGSIAAGVSHFENIGVIWFDAHADFNNEESSPSGNMHGMPLSAVCGFGPDAMIGFMKEKKYVNPKNVALVGARDIDPEEKKRLRESGVHVFSISEIDKLGMAEVVSRAIKVAGAGTQGIHVSFDIDVITPNEAPGVGTPVHSGITLREAFLFAEILAESNKILSIDMVEVNPLLDRMNATGRLASELILSMMGKVIY